MAKQKRAPKKRAIEVHLDRADYFLLEDLAGTQSLYTGEKVTMGDLIRSAITFTFRHNELLREFFRRRKKYGNTRYRF